MTASRLSRAGLSALPDGVARPRYDPSALRAGIVHLGLGNFHRAHMARYVDALVDAQSDARRWGIIGATLIPADAPLMADLARQDGLYTLTERGVAQGGPTVIGSLVGLIDAGGSTKNLLAAIDRPEIRIVSLTVTEHGYGLDRGTRTLDPTQPTIARDLANPRAPASAIGILTEAYRRRRAAGGPAFTALSCDNMPSNGAVLRDAVLAFAQRYDPGLADWIARYARFPSTMVDRITPVTQSDDTAWLADRFGIVDARPVFCESFSQWVIEDDFADGRPDWHHVGVQFVADVAPYELMKLRFLNASHLAVAALGRLMNHDYVAEAMADPGLREYMTMLMDRETGPMLPPIPGIDLAAYKAKLIERFFNPMIRDTVERVNTDAPVNYLLDPIRDCLSAGLDINLLALALAAWIRRVRGIDERGRSIDVRHPLSALLRDRAVSGGSNPRAVLSITALFGDLAHSEALAVPVGQHLSALYDFGANKALAICLERERLT